MFGLIWYDEKDSEIVEYMQRFKPSKIEISSRLRRAHEQTRDMYLNYQTKTDQVLGIIEDLKLKIQAYTDPSWANERSSSLAPGSILFVCRHLQDSNGRKCREGQYWFIHFGMSSIPLGHEVAIENLKLVAMNEAKPFIDSRYLEWKVGRPPEQQYERYELLYFE
jgi:hypothetical protein